MASKPHSYQSIDGMGLFLWQVKDEGAYLRQFRQMPNNSILWFFKVNPYCSQIWSWYFSMRGCSNSIVSPQHVQIKWSWWRTWNMRSYVFFPFWKECASTNPQSVNNFKVRYRVAIPRSGWCNRILFLSDSISTCPSKDKKTSSIIFLCGVQRRFCWRRKSLKRSNSFSIFLVEKDYQSHNIVKKV